MTTLATTSESLGIEVLNATGRAVEGRTGIRTQLRNAKMRSLTEEEALRHLERALNIPVPDQILGTAKVLILDQTAKVGGKIRVRWVSGNDEGYTTLDGAIPRGFIVLVQPDRRPNRWGR